VVVLADVTRTARRKAMRLALSLLILTLTLAALVGCGPVFGPGSVTVKVYATMYAQVGSATQPAMKLDPNAVVIRVDTAGLR
jgi:hypothetical protein